MAIILNTFFFGSLYLNESITIRFRMIHCIFLVSFSRGFSHFCISIHLKRNNMSTLGSNFFLAGQKLIYSLTVRDIFLLLLLLDSVFICTYISQKNTLIPPIFKLDALLIHRQWNNGVIPIELFSDNTLDYVIYIYIIYLKNEHS